MNRVELRDKIKTQFMEKVSGKSVKHYIEEWDLELYITPPNLSTMVKLAANAEENTLDALITMIIDCCKDENGKSYFKAEDREFLMTEADPDVVIALGTRVGEGISSIQEAGKTNRPQQGLS